MSDGDISLREEIGVVYDGDNFPDYLSAEKLANVIQNVFQRHDDETCDSCRSCPSS
jgi:ABC-2 type transport system ATP-binding protein